MNSPFIYITTHGVDPEDRDQLDALLVDYHRLLQEREPDLLAHHAYFDDSGTELSLVQVHRNPESAEQHMRVARELIQKGWR